MMVGRSVATIRLVSPLPILRKQIHGHFHTNIACYSQFVPFVVYDSKHTDCITFDNSWREREQKQNSSSSSRQSNNHRIPASLFAGNILMWLLGWEDYEMLDDDPLKDKVKWSMLHRKYGRYQQALEVLQQALQEAEKLGNPKFVTRIYDEIANTYYEANELDNAYNTFRIVIQRLITIHRKNEASPEFIGISLKLADILARKGDIELADIGYRHCMAKQVEAVNNQMAQYHISHGAMFESQMPVDELGLDYIEPFALFGMCMHEYALFIMDFYADTRFEEAQEYVNEALKISYKIYGLSSFHSLNILSTFAAKCVLKNKFDVARKYLELGLDRVLMPECESVSEKFLSSQEVLLQIFFLLLFRTILLSYYCCYAEALFHTGELEKAVDFAKRASELAKNYEDDAVRSYVKDFVKKIQRDALREQRKAEGKVSVLDRIWPF